MVFVSSHRFSIFLHISSAASCADSPLLSFLHCSHCCIRRPLYFPSNLSLGTSWAISQWAQLVHQSSWGKEQGQPHVFQCAASAFVWVFLYPVQGKHCAYVMRHGRLNRFRWQAWKTHAVRPCHPAVIRGTWCRCCSAGFSFLSSFQCFMLAWFGYVVPCGLDVCHVSSCLCQVLSRIQNRMCLARSCNLDSLSFGTWGSVPANCGRRQVAEDAQSWCCCYFIERFHRSISETKYAG